MADQAINALSTKTAPETSDQLLLVGTGEPQLIDYDKLADAILNKITSKNYALDAGQMTLLAALNKLNSDMTPIISWKSPSDNIIVPANSFFDFEIDISIPGYEAMGVIGRQMNAPNCYTLKESISGGTNLNITIMNTTASSIYIKPAFLIIYYKNRI